MNELQTLPQGTEEELLERIRQMDTEDIVKALDAAFRWTLAGLEWMALLLRVAEQERGRDLSGLRNTFMRWVRRIAYRQVLADVVFLLQDEKKAAAARSIARLPILEQRRLVSGERLRLIVFGADGKTTHIMADPFEMTADQLRQVFGGSAVRNDAEQVLYLQDLRTKAALPVPEKIGEKVEIVKEDFAVRVGRYVVPGEDIIRAADALKRLKRQRMGARLEEQEN